MHSLRILIVAREEPRFHRTRDRLAAAGLEAHYAANAAAGLLLLGRLQPDVLVLDPHATRGHPEDWKRAIDRYRRGRSLAVVLTTDDTSARTALAAVTDGPCLPRCFPVGKLLVLLAAMGDLDDYEAFRLAG